MEVGNRMVLFPEKILRSHLSKQNGAKRAKELAYLIGSATLEKRQYSIPIARLVYYLFVKRFDFNDTLLAVNCSDGDPLNIRPDNLLLVTKSSILKKSFEENNRKWVSIKFRALRVSQYDMNGKWKSTFSSINAASIQTGIHHGCISKGLKTESGFANNFMWRYGDSHADIEIPLSVQKLQASRRRYAGTISQYDLKGKKVGEYSNLKEAARHCKIPETSIRDNMSGFRMTMQGHIWKAGNAETISVAFLEEARKLRGEKNAKVVSQYDLTGHKIKTYPGILEASRQLKINSKTISWALQKEGKIIGSGFLWVYGDGPASIEVPKGLNGIIIFSGFTTSL